MSATLHRYRAEGDSRLAHDKNQQERRRNLLVMIANYLLDSGIVRSPLGYTDASNAVQKETGLSLDKWEVADNISLYYVLQDYEEYHEIRHSKKPKLVKKLNEKISLPKIKTKPSLPVSRPKPKQVSS